MATGPVVGIIGLTALQRDFKRMTGDNTALARTLQDAAKQALAPVQSAVMGALPARDENRRGGHPAGTLAADVRIGANRKGAGIRMGRAKVNWAGPTEFGGYPKATENSAGRPFDPRGRYMYPAAEPLREQIAADYERAMQVALDAFDWTNEGGTPHD